jgi:hypothetical protein
MGLAVRIRRQPPLSGKLSLAVTLKVYIEAGGTG